VSHDRKEAYDRRNARNNPRRVGMSPNYLGMAPRPEQAKALNALRREYRDRQNQSGT
jgi:hypothetical protein